MALRERKKLRTREAISTAAIELFVEHGFDQVSITQVAEAAEVSRRTLFAYFPTKEDLVIHRFADHEDEPPVSSALAPPTSHRWPPCTPTSSSASALTTRSPA